MSPDNTNTTNTEQAKVVEKEAVTIAAVAQISEPIIEDKPEDPNWRAFRDGRKKDRLEKEAAERKATEKQAEIDALKAAMEAAFSKAAPQLQQEQGGYNAYGEDETEDQRIEKKVQEAIAKREAAAARDREERDRKEMPNRFAKAYPDQAQVLSDENMAYLEYHYPELTRPLSRMPDHSFEKWEDIYKAIKKFVPNTVNVSPEAKRAEANINKPKSMSTANVTHSGETGGSIRLTEERKRANWERMQKTLKQV